jgi:hypothetical protein
MPRYALRRREPDGFPDIMKRAACCKEKNAFCPAPIAQASRCDRSVGRSATPLLQVTVE